ncbi:ABC transporter substrate-binding protein [Gluconacetobacter tumulicola]|uniref:ABC transporter substrate-binding protein n=1 Tax=Gluconacetobacter tumulicola TaxID=1017177 RepID=A0A7W4JEP1_9PROT|nr:ABC transporter substrate-binding protein [Gluconacetobacter tumulicola]MBB2179881.1 ABC transporter substrate-binding protein [Gluconacetobacter tumulicola]
MTRPVLSRALSRRALLAAAPLAAVGGSRFARAAPAPFRFLTNWYAQAEHAGFYQALARGFYRDVGLDVVIEHGAPQSNNTQLLVAGRYDVVIGSIGATMMAAARGMPTVAVATSFQSSLVGLLTHPDITRLADLKGHTILLSTEIRAAFWPWLRDHYGFDESQVRPYSFNIQPFILDPGLVIQSYATSEPYALQKAGVSCRFFPLDDATYHDYGNPLVTTRDVLAHRREDLVRFLQASMRGWADWMSGDPTPGNDAIRAANPRMGLDQIMWSRQRFRAMGVFGPAGARYGTITAPRCQAIRDFLVATGQLPAGARWQDACDFSFASALTSVVA